MLGKREQKKISKHISVGVILAWLCFMLLAGRYAWIQIVQGDQFAARMRHESGEERVVQSPRGAILDRNGRELAVSLMMKSLFIDPNSVRDAADVARKLAPLVGLTEDEILRDIDQGGGFVWVKHYLNTDEIAAVRKLIRGEEYICLGFKDEPKRSYPNDELAANVLGFVGTDDIGLDGIEQAYDDMIKGAHVESFIQTDNVSDRPILGSIFAKKSYSGEQCKTIELTLDYAIQFMVEEALEEAVAETNPLSVTAVVMNPKTGEVLAMASRPSYDPNHFEDYPMEAWKNRSVSFIYEPGSTFKSIAAAAALEEGVVTPDKWFVDPGYIMVSERRIQNWNGESFGTVTFTDIVKQSLNTGFAQVGLELGAERLDEYAKRFGFGSMTGIELPAEEAGLLFPDPKEMRDSDIATMAIGQSIAVTPLQLVTAMSAIANDGILMKPYIVKSIKNFDGSVYEETKPEEVRRAIKSETASTLVDLLEQVVSDGGGKKARVTGYRVAGKTGTAEKIRTDGVGYMEGRYIASFCGFAPVEDPEVALLVIIDDPSGNFYGGQVAAPVASRIFSQIFRYMHIEPSTDPLAEKHKEGDTSIRQAESLANASHAVVPDVTGMDAAETQMTLENAGLKLRAEGRGTAISQDVPPNTVVMRGTEIVVRFAPG